MINQEEGKKEPVKSETEKQFDVLVPGGKRVIRDMGGNEYEIPEKLPLSRQIPINRAVARMIRSIPKLGEMMEAGEKGEEVRRDQMEMLASFADAFYSDDSLLILSHLLGKPVKWVSENISEEEMIGAVTPFFFRRIGSLTRVLSAGLGLGRRSGTG